MNIFVTDSCPIQSARNLPDKHIVKMPLETCQMLAIIYSDWYYGVGKLYKHASVLQIEITRLENILYKEKANGF